MKCVYKKGFSIVEIIISLNIIVLLLGIVYYVIDQSIYYNKNHIIYNNILSTNYNIIQIIKSDSYFYQHPELYFVDPDNSINKITSGNLTELTLFFNEFNELSSNSDYVYKIYIMVNVYTNKIVYSTNLYNKHKTYFEDKYYTSYQVTKYEE